MTVHRLDEVLDARTAREAADALLRQAAQPAAEAPATVENLSKRRPA